MAFVLKIKRSFGAAACRQRLFKRSEREQDRPHPTGFGAVRSIRIPVHRSALSFLIACLALVLCAVGPLISGARATGPDLHVLKGRIIRSLSVDAADPSHIVVGQKGPSAGAALVFQSLDGGRSWRTLNGNRPLAAPATDVQAVLAVSKDVLLAGTWKHGLYVSRTGGTHRFARVADFPATDIRDLKMAKGVIYAATGRNGVFRSGDLGESWEPIGPDGDFLWSISVFNGDIYASSPETGVHLWRDGAWRKRVSEDKAYAVAVTATRMAIAGEAGLRVDREGRRTGFLTGERLADVLITPDASILAASWGNGVAVLEPDGRSKRRLLADTAVVHLARAGNRLLAGTWGDGLHILALPNALIEATKRNDTDTVRRLLAAGADPDLFDQNRNTALIFAARDGFTDIAAALIAAGADVNWVDGEQVTPLILAAHKNHPKLVELLLAHGADRTPRDQWGRTALDYAKQRGERDPIAGLLTR